MYTLSYYSTCPFHGTDELGIPSRQMFRSDVALQLDNPCSGTTTVGVLIMDHQESSYNNRKYTTDNTNNAKH